MLAGLERCVEAVQQFRRDGLGVPRVLQAWQQDDEFIAPQPCDGIDVAQVFLEPVSNAFEQ